MNQISIAFKWFYVLLMFFLGFLGVRLVGKGVGRLLYSIDETKENDKE